MSEHERPEPKMDRDAYPSRKLLRAIREWPLSDINGLLDFIAATWHYQSFGVSHELSAHEGYVVHAEPEDRYLRLATGGWSGNEDLIAAFNRNYVAHAMTWQLSAVGGLYIYKYLAESTK